MSTPKLLSEMIKAFGLILTRKSHVFTDDFIPILVGWAHVLDTIVRDQGYAT